MRSYFSALRNKLNTSIYLYGCSQKLQPLANGLIRVSEHIHSAQYSININTDTLSTKYERCLMWLYQFGFKSTVFDYLNTTLNTNMYNTDLVDLGVYIVNGSAAQTGLRADPVDYTAVEAVRSLVQTSRGGNKPTILSYGNGYDDYKLNCLSVFLGGRNSRHTNDTKDYGVTGGANNLIDSLCYKNLIDIDLISRPSTNRWNYYSQSSNAGAEFVSGTEIEGQEDFKRKIENTYNTSGFYSSFGHWHWTETDWFKRYLTVLDTETATHDVFKGGFSEISEYSFVKNAVDSLTINSGVVTIDYSKKYINSPYEDITTKLWIEFNTVGTSFENKDITTSVSSEIIKKADNLFSIGVDLNFNNTTLIFTISETLTPSYLNLIKPVVSVNTSTGVVTTDQPIKYTLFRKTKAQNEWDVVVEEFNSAISSSHTLTGLDTVTYDYYLGFSNAAKVSGLINF